MRTVAPARASADPVDSAAPLADLLVDPGHIATMPVEHLPAVQQEITRALLSLAAAASAVTARLVATHATPVPGGSARLLDVQEAASRLGMSTDWLYRNAKRLPFTRRVGRRALKFDADGLTRWLAAQRRT